MDPQSSRGWQKKVERMSIKKSQKIVCVIPARLASTRFPRKMLSLIAGRPLLQWVWEAAQKVAQFDEVVFAVDAQETADLIASFGGTYHLTSPACPAGTHRLVELCITKKIEADIWVNWQGDEPFIIPSMISELLQSIDTDTADMWTLKKLITNPEEIHASRIAKVVSDVRGNALYFSRAPIPFSRDEQDLMQLIQKKIYYKHVGLYAYTTQALQAIATMPSTPLETTEQLEMLQFLAHGLTIKLHETEHDVFGIDFFEDLAKAEVRAQKLNNQPISA